MNESITSERVEPLPRPTQDVAQAKRDLDRCGYAIHDALLSPDEVKRIRERMEEQAELECEQGVATYRMADANVIGERRLGRPPAGSVPAWQALLALPNKGREFIDLAMHPVVAEYGRHLFGSVPHYLAQSTGLFVRRGSGGQVLHSDQIVLPFGTPRPVYFHAMVALSDFEAGMGCTEMVPGSHLWPAPRIGIDPKTHKATSLETYEAVPMQCKAGSAILFESRTWHFQGRSISDKTRVSILNGYCMHWMRAQDDYVASLHDDVYERLSMEERRMLGFEVVSEYTGRFFPRDPTDRRCNTNARYPFIPELRRGGHAKAVPFEGMGTDES
jgi:ectoine hydroxylase-related dioxygenase (phytanoyl-CoA dioxygenase family)